MIFIIHLQFNCIFEKQLLKDADTQLKYRSEFTFLSHHCAFLLRDFSRRDIENWSHQHVTHFSSPNSASHTLRVIIKCGQKFKWQQQYETRRLLIVQHHLGVDCESEHRFRHRILTPCSCLERTPASHEPDCSPVPVCSLSTALLSSPRGLRVSFCA